MTLRRDLQRLEVGSSLTVGTPSLPAMNEVARQRDVELMGLGGILRPEACSFTGSMAVRELSQLLSQLHLDVAFIGATALRDGESLYGNPYDAEIKRAMREAAQWAALVVDSSKFDRAGMVRILPIDAYDAIVVDDRVAADDLELLRGLDLELHLAPMEEASA